MPDIFRSWKTTVVGIAIVALSVAFVMGKIDTQAFLAALAVLTGGGFIASKDTDVSGK